MKNFIAILFLLLFSDTKLLAQQSQMDSLHAALKKAPDDITRMRLHGSIGFYYVESNRDSALYYMEKNIAMTRHLNWKIGEATYLDFKAYTLMLMDNYPKSLEASLMALKIAEDPESEKNDLSKSKTSPAYKRQQILANIHYNMGLLYGATGNTNLQVSNFQKAINIASSVQNLIKVAEVKISLGEVYIDINKLDAALLMENNALQVISDSPQVAFKKYEGVIHWNIGKIYQLQSKPDLAKSQYFRAIQANLVNHNMANMGDCFISLAQLYQRQAMQDSATYYALKALHTHQLTTGSAKAVAASYSLLANLYNQQNKTDSALVYLQLATVLKDSLTAAEKRHLAAFQDVGFEEQLRLAALEKEKIQTQNKIRVYSLIAGLFVFSLVVFILYRNNKQKQQSNKILETALTNLKSTQSQLIQSEKMASLGELTAGIAHEIQNPLNFVNNFSELSNELIGEMKAELDKGDFNEAKAIAGDIEQNLEKINHHGRRADAIVKGMLQHSRNSDGKKEPTNINALCDEYLRLAYHGLRAKDKSFNATLKTDFDNSIGKINIVPQDIGRVIMNLLTNAFYTVNEKAKTANPDPQPGTHLSPGGAKYEPTVSISTKKTTGTIEIKIADNGNGIPSHMIDKIFQPFFTTKPTGQGTGLGLSLSFDIIKMHGGELSVETREGEFAKFTITLPV